MNNLPRSMNVSEASIYLAVHRATLCRLAKAGAISARKIAGRTVFLRDELDKYLEALPLAFESGSPQKLS